MPAGIPIIISAPSGTGKSTICRRLLELRGDLAYSISYTTRRPRAGEKNGKHYFFVSKEEFKRKIAHHEFAEWALVFDQYKGTPRDFLDETLKEGKHVLLAIDIQGAMAIKRKKPESVAIFVTPPSIESLRERLAARQDSLHSVAKRLANSKQELLAAKDYDYVVVNDDLDKAVSQIDCIITAESLKTSRQEISQLIPLALTREVNLEA